MLVNFIRQLEEYSASFGVSLVMQEVLDKQHLLPGGGLEGRDFRRLQSDNKLLNVGAKRHDFLLLTSNTSCPVKRGTPQL